MTGNRVNGQKLGDRDRREEWGGGDEGREETRWKGKQEGTE